MSGLRRYVALNTVGNPPQHPRGAAFAGTDFTPIPPAPPAVEARLTGAEMNL